MTDQSHRLAGARSEARAFQNPFRRNILRDGARLLAREMCDVVSEPNILEANFDSLPSLENVDGLPTIRNTRRGIEKSEDALRARHRGLQNVVFLRKVLQRLEESSHQLEECGDGANAKEVSVHA